MILQYKVGYMNKTWGDKEFVIMAESDSRQVAMFICNSYNKEYKRSGMTTKLEVLEEHELPKFYSYAN